MHRDLPLREYKCSDNMTETSPNSGENGHLVAPKDLGIKDLFALKWRTIIGTVQVSPSAASSGATLRKQGRD